MRPGPFGNSNAKENGSSPQARNTYGSWGRPREGGATYPCGHAILEATVRELQGLYGAHSGCKVRGLGHADTR